MREKYLWNGKRQLSRADRSHINYFAASSGVDFINVLKAAFANTEAKLIVGGRIVRPEIPPPKLVK